MKLHDNSRRRRKRKKKKKSGKYSIETSQTFFFATTTLNWINSSRHNIEIVVQFLMNFIWVMWHWSTKLMFSWRIVGKGRFNWLDYYYFSLMYVYFSFVIATNVPAVRIVCTTLYRWHSNQKKDGSMKLE